MPDYDALMTGRLKILDQHGFTTGRYPSVIDKMGPWKAPSDFVAWLRERTPGDYFVRYLLSVRPAADAAIGISHALLQSIGNRAQTGRIVNYHMRMPNQKKQSVAALKILNFHVIAAGDAYNDTAMLGEAHAGFFFCPPDHLPKEFPQFPVTKTYGSCKRASHRQGISNSFRFE